MNQIKNYGLVLKEKDPRRYTLGVFSALPKFIVRPDRNWLFAVPNFEPQKKNFETANCTGFNILEQIEVYLKAVFGVDVNYSDRALGIFAKTYPPGNDPHVVYEAIRNKGLVTEEKLPFSDDLKDVKEYYSYKGGNKEAIEAEGKKWLEIWSFGHEYVFEENTKNKAEKIWEALLYSPVCVSVDAWKKEGNYYVKPKGGKDNHWTLTVVGGEYKKFWVVKDSYIEDGTPIKYLAWDYDFQIGKRIHIERQTVKEQISLIKKILNLMYQLLPMLKKEEEKPVEVPGTPVVSQPVPPSSKYDWDTPVLARHSVRVICDEEKLSVADKNDLCATVGAESGWKPSAKLENKKNGKVWSTDWGICQINDYYHIGSGKSFPSVEYVVNNPEACIRWMCKQWKAGNKTWWVAYKNKSYKKFL